MTGRRVAIVAGCILLAFSTGWCWGVSGRTTMAVQLSDTTIRADVAEVRAAILEARLSVHQANFGDARRSLQRARTVAGQLQARLREVGQAARAGAVGDAIARLEDAERLSGSLDPAASDAAAEALRSLESSVPVTGS